VFTVNIGGKRTNARSGSDAALGPLERTCQAARNSLGWTSTSDLGPTTQISQYIPGISRKRTRRA